MQSLIVYRYTYNVLVACIKYYFLSLYCQSVLSLNVKSCQKVEDLKSFIKELEQYIKISTENFCTKVQGSTFIAGINLNNFL